MSSKLEKLFFHVALIDGTSKGVDKITAKIDGLQQRAKKGMQGIAIGAAGLAATGYGLSRLLQPSKEMNQALGETASLFDGDASAAMAKLSKTAVAHSMEYGTSATEFVKASYDIQSAIAGLTGDELSQFTKNSAVLAKATKADAGTITNYMGTMFGIFKNQAVAMGKNNWAEVLTGQTASAVQMFKTTGGEMSAAFTSVGAEATSSGIAMNEQMAILGTLQATMSGSEAGTKYKAFLGGVGKAQKMLGLQLQDSQGKMLPMVEILSRIKGKFGDIDTVAKSDLLAKAFGTKEATGVIKLLMADTDGLANSIQKLGNVTGMDKATQMAKANVNVWDQLSSTGTGMAIVLGQVMQPALTPLLAMVIRMGKATLAWSQEHPTLTKYLGLATLALFGLVAIASTFALVGGIATMATVGWGTATLATSVIFGTLGKVMAFAKAQTIAFGVAALIAGAPIWLIVAAVTAVIAAVAALIYYWDDLKTSLMDSKAFKAVAGFFGFASSGDAPNMPTLNSGSSDPNAGGGNNTLHNISSAVSNNQRSINVEKIEMNGSSKGGQDIADELAMVAG
ncbi:phage tail tape measure protein [Dasania marina]|uniref:phage tail tape measure protein n=1 Tax=Dasania marina TaxID=471499 RepID=UPI000381E1DA|nr:phage tail tape measure protein [Dasania marina]